MRTFESPDALVKALWDEKDNTRPEVLQDLASKVPEEFRDEFTMGMAKEIDSLLPIEQRYNYGRKLDVAKRLLQLSGQDEPDEEAPVERDFHFGPLRRHAKLRLLALINLLLPIALFVLTIDSFWARDARWDRILLALYLAWVIMFQMYVIIMWISFRGWREVFEMRKFRE